MVRIQPSFIFVGHLYLLLSLISSFLSWFRGKGRSYDYSHALVHVLRSYCNTDLHPEHRHLSQLEAIKLYLKGKEPLLQCECVAKKPAACMRRREGAGLNSKASLALVLSEAVLLHGLTSC